MTEKILDCETRIDGGVDLIEGRGSTVERFELSKLSAQDRRLLTEPREPREPVRPDCEDCQRRWLLNVARTFPCPDAATGGSVEWNYTYKQTDNCSSRKPRYEPTSD